MKKAVRCLILALIVMVLCITLSGCSATCKAPGCKNKPAEILGVKSEYCILHIGYELQ